MSHTILAIDTATDQASLAILDQRGITAELSWLSRGNHSRKLDDLLPRVLAVAGAGVHNLTGIAVASGPGSFNGLRVGISFAKGLALARRIPLAGISTLDIIAFAAARDERTVCACLPAGRGELYLAHYAGEGPTWRRISEYTRAGIEAAAGMYQLGTLLAGEGAPTLAEFLHSREVTPHVVSDAARLRRAGFLAELGRRYFDAHGTDRLDDIQPLYLRRSAAEEKRAASQGD